MVAYLLADAVFSEQLDLDDSISSLWQNAPESINYLQLVTHTSGLPRLPDDLQDTGFYQNPYVHYSQALLEKQLARLKGAANQLQPGLHLYSNLAFGLLAESLARLQETSFNQLIGQRLFKLLDMTDTYLALPSRQSAHIAMGHDSLGNKVLHWHFDALAGAGAVVSTLPDMVKYIRGMMDKYQQSDRLVALLMQPQLALNDSVQQGLGWFLGQDKQGRAYAYHGGQTGGFSAFVGFYLDGSAGLVMLNNQSIDLSKLGKEKMLAISK